MKQLMNPYDAGKDCGLNGPNQQNCHFSWFARKDMTLRWQEGKRAGEKEKIRELPKQRKRR